MNKSTAKNWSEIIAVNLENHSPERMFNLMTAILATQDLKLLAEFCVEMIIFVDLLNFNNNPNDLENVLRQNGWVAYSTRTHQQNLQDFVSRDDLLDYFFGSYTLQIITSIEAVITKIKYAATTKPQ
jgi:hypothetical protein